MVEGDISTFGAVFHIFLHFVLHVSQAVRVLGMELLVEFSICRNLASSAHQRTTTCDLALKVI